MSCQGFVQCILKLINFLVTVVGAFMIVYSLWMLKEWNSIGHLNQGVPSTASALLSGGVMSVVSDGIQNTEGLIFEQIRRPFLKENSQLSDLPAPWYVIH